jgi:hypothetical protein
MSIDAGGLAQMAYQSPFNGSIGVSGPGYASRGKAGHIKRLSVAPPSSISTIDELQANTVATPRTSRGHMLAGLRTAPKSATVAPSNQGLEGSRYASSPYSNQVPQTAATTYFPSNRNSMYGNNYQQQQQATQYHYSRPEQVLAPPTLDFADANDSMDQQLYDELVATNNYLAQQQRALQQQLLSVTAAAHQLSGLNLNTNFQNNLGQQQFQSPTVSSPMGLYNQQLQQGLQPVVQPVPGSPGVFAVYNPMTGQSSYVVDPNYQHQQQEVSPVRHAKSVSPPPVAPAYQRQYNETSVSQPESRAKTPPKTSPSPPVDVEPLPPPSANAFRRGHRKNMSSANIKTTGEWTKNSGLRSAGVPQTPATATFAPGHGRAGDHPARQPKGPPLLQELEEKPTSKHEGSKNFATRQRRRAVHDLVRAGRDRVRQPGSGAGTPASEGEFNFSVSSEDSVLAGSSSLSSKLSLGSLRAAANGAIGSEIKEKSRERSSVDSVGALSARSLSSEEGSYVGVETEPARRNTPLLVLSSAEKRKSVVM